MKKTLKGMAGPEPGVAFSDVTVLSNTALVTITLKSMGLPMALHPEPKMVMATADFFWCSRSPTYQSQPRSRYCLRACSCLPRGENHFLAERTRSMGSDSIDSLRVVFGVLPGFFIVHLCYAYSRLARCPLELGRINQPVFMPMTTTSFICMH